MLTKLSHSLLALCITACAYGQAMYQNSARVIETNPILSLLETEADTIIPEEPISLLDSIMHLADTIPFDTVMVIKPLSRAVFMPVVYTHYNNFTDYKPFAPDYVSDPAMGWLDEAAATNRNEQMLIQRFAVNYPQFVRYNLATLPEAPKQYIAEVDPSKHTIEIKELLPDTPDKLATEFQKKHWLRTFNSSLQFSQAFVSPNWYQGGNDNLNFLMNVFYNVKLNQAFHPKILFETTLQYKLGLNSAPDDSLRNYSISEDLFQANVTFGYKAAHHWYYSVTGQFKTQLLNSYIKNTRTLNSALLSPGELTAGVGMTYNYTSPKKRFVFDASISPLSYNLKMCIKPDDKVSHESFDIRPNRKTASKYGSSAECKLTWQMAANIQYRSRVFFFTDYGYIQGDWENTLAMDINRYLTTQIYCHVRYDSTTPACDSEHWHKLQVKEILSFGVQYKFTSF